jgi:hypothetical protein
MKCISIFGLVFFLSGCCSLCPTKTDVIYVKTGCVPPPVVSAPALKINSISADSTYKETVEAFVFDAMALQEYTNQLLQALEPYNSCGQIKAK